MVERLWMMSVCVVENAGCTLDLSMCLVLGLLA